MIMFDCEVFKEDWLFVFIDSEDSTNRNIIVNDSDKLKEFYEKNKDEIFGGYNARSYDQYIFKAILCDENPKKVNDYIINGMNGGSYSKDFSNINLLIYDVMIDKMKSLKQLEGFMGNDIRETTVPFDINRKLNEKELQEVIKYCTHDVEQTIEVFKRQPEELESQKALVATFDLPTQYLNKTKAQLSAIILGAENKGNRYDDYDITFPDTLILSEKYKYIYNWYNVPINRCDKMSLTTKVMGVPHKFAWGGIHGAILNYSGEGYYIMSDVASLYPSIMIEYGFLSRNVKDRSKYKQIRDERLRLKALKDAKQLPMKIVLNSTYGASKDKYNALFDPLMANNVCVTGQLLLLDLIDKLEIKFGDKCELIQSNTDGILVKLPDQSYHDEYVDVCKEWEKRTRLDLEHDVYVKVFQKDVNNYIIVDAKGKYKSKGAYVKKLNDLDYDLPIVNKALINKLIYDKPLMDTIMECNELKEFQKIVKVNRNYDYAMFGETPLTERVLRVFASTDDNDCGIYKFRNGKADKVGNTPEVAFIHNDDVNGIACPDKLDRQWYVELAIKRYDDFMARENIEDGLDVYELINDHYTDFTDVIIDVRDKSIHKNKEFTDLISIGYFSSFGSVKKLLTQYDMFNQIYNKKSISIDKLLSFGITDFEQYGKVGVKNVTKLDSVALYNDVCKLIPCDEYDIQTLLSFQLDVLGKVYYSNPNIDKKTCFVLSVEKCSKTKVKIKAVSLNNGRVAEFYIGYSEYSNDIINEGMIINIISMQKKFKPLALEKNEKGKVTKWGSDMDVVEWWMNGYRIIKDFKIN